MKSWKISKGRNASKSGWEPLVYTSERYNSDRELRELLVKLRVVNSRGVTRSDGARGKKQVWRAHVRT